MTPRELPLDYLDAFRLASFGIEYVPVYAPVMLEVDWDCADARWYNIEGRPAYELSVLAPHRHPMEGQL